MMEKGFTAEMMLELKWRSDDKGQCTHAHANKVAHEVRDDLLQFTMLMTEDKARRYRNLHKIALEEQAHMDANNKKVKCSSLSQCGSSCA